MDKLKRGNGAVDWLWAYSCLGHHSSRFYRCRIGWYWRSQRVERSPGIVSLSIIWEWVGAEHWLVLTLHHYNVTMIYTNVQARHKHSPWRHRICTWARMWRVCMLSKAISALRMQNLNIITFESWCRSTRWFPHWNVQDCFAVTSQTKEKASCSTVLLAMARQCLQRQPPSLLVAGFRVCLLKAYIICNDLLNRGIDKNFKSSGNWYCSHYCDFNFRSVHAWHLGAYLPGSEEILVNLFLEMRVSGGLSKFSLQYLRELLLCAGIG